MSSPKGYHSATLVLMPCRLWHLVHRVNGNECPVVRHPLQGSSVGCSRAHYWLIYHIGSLNGSPVAFQFVRSFDNEPSSQLSWAGPNVLPMFTSHVGTPTLHS